MAIEKALFLALLVALVLLGQSAAHALPGAHSGLASDSAVLNSTSLPARR